MSPMTLSYCTTIKSKTWNEVMWKFIVFLILSVSLIGFAHA